MIPQPSDSQIQVVRRHELPEWMSPGDLHALEDLARDLRARRHIQMSQQPPFVLAE